MIPSAKAFQRFKLTCRPVLAALLVLSLAFSSSRYAKGQKRIKHEQIQPGGEIPERSNLQFARVDAQAIISNHIHGTWRENLQDVDYERLAEIVSEVLRTSYVKHTESGWRSYFGSRPVPLYKWGIVFFYLGEGEGFGFKAPPGCDDSIWVPEKPCNSGGMLKQVMSGSQQSAVSASWILLWVPESEPAVTNFGYLKGYRSLVEDCAQDISRALDGGVQPSDIVDCTTVAVLQQKRGPLRGMLVVATNSVFGFSNTFGHLYTEEKLHTAAVDARTKKLIKGPAVFAISMLPLSFS